VLSEVFYDPPPQLGDDEDYEWVEVYNATGDTVDLAGWSVNGVPLTGSFPPHEYGVLARQGSSDPDGDGDHFEAWFTEANGYRPDMLVLDAGGADLGLDNSFGSVELRDPLGTLMDEVSYSAAQGGAATGESLERFTPPPHPGNAIWEESETGLELGTPGLQNSQAALTVRVELQETVLIAGDDLAGLFGITNNTYWTAIVEVEVQAPDSLGIPQPILNTIANLLPQYSAAYDVYAVVPDSLGQFEVLGFAGQEEASAVADREHFHVAQVEDVGPGDMLVGEESK
jgi:hypothetical protein